MMNPASTILIVDDVAANRETLLALLNNPDYRLVEASDGPEALKLAVELLPDLILLDVMMPEMDGFEVCRRLRALPSVAEVPVIMITALDDRQSRIMGIGCGADDFISKPFDSAELRTRVRTITRLNRYARLNRERANVEAANQKIVEQAGLIDLATDAIVVLDLTGRVESWNPGAETIFGPSAAQACGQLLGGLLNPADLHRLDAALVDTLLQGEWRGDLQACRLNGDKVLAHSHWIILSHPDGRPRGVLTVSTDQTEFRQVQAQLFRAQRLESLGALASGIAHDLNNVLAPVLMAAELLQTNPPVEVQMEMARVIQTSAEHGVGLVRQILAFARGSEGTERTQVQPLHLVIDVVGLARESFPKTILISSQSNQEVDLIQADPTQMHQVILNLMVNARDAMPDGGTLTVSVANVLIDPAFAAQKPGVRPGPYIVLRVQDTGMGMSAAVLAKIWLPFFTTKPPGSGTGIGLTTVAKIVQQHHGFVEVTSQPGSGTTFSVFLPAIAPEHKASELPVVTGTLPLGRGERVLVVDDEAALVQLVQTILIDHNYLPTVADGPGAALRTIAGGKGFDLALLDLDMPLMDGQRLARVLHNLKPDMRIILVTGSHRMRETPIAAGEFAAVVTKPFTAATLLHAMDAVLHGPVAV